MKSGDFMDHWNVDYKLISELYEGAYIVDKHRKIVYWNEGCERITGYQRDDIINKHCYNNLLQHVDDQGKHLCLEGCPLLKVIKDGHVHESRVYLKHREGHRVPVMVKAMPIFNDENEIVGAVEVFTDERFQKQVYQENIELMDQLKIDTLTKIPNRHFFDFQIGKRLEEAKFFQSVFGLLVIDIDHFKAINDTYGHLIGDEILKVVAHSLSSNIKKTDIISRWGGEEFIAIIEVDNASELHVIAERLRALVMESSYQVDQDNSLHVTVSIGGTLYQLTDDSKSMIKRADQAMYHAKNQGRNCVVIND